MFTILDRYLVREIVAPMLLALVVFTFVLEIPPILQQAESLISRGVAWSVVLQVLLTLLPQALSLTIPIAVLLGILMGFGRLSADREFVAMQACGVSLLRVARPVILVALAGTAATAYEVIVALPDANQTFREITLGLLKEQVETKIKPRVFFQELPDHVIYVQDVSAEGGWRHMFVADTTRPDYTTVYFAQEGRVLVDREKQLVHLQLVDGTSHTTIGSRPDFYDGGGFERMTIVLNPKSLFPESPSRGAPEMTFAELDARIAEAAATGEPAIPERFMRSYKIALPLTCPILALIGLALGATNRKDGKFASFVVGLGVIVVYYILIYGTRSFAMGGRLNPAVAPWVPHLVMAAAAAAMVTWRARRADQPIRVSLPAFWRRAPVSGGSSVASTPPRVVVVVRLPHLNLPAPRLLDTYLGREYLRVFLLGVLGLMVIFYISTFIDLVDKLFRGDTTTTMLLRFFYFQTPLFMYYVIPMAVLVASLVTFGVLAKNNELMVMRACGISLYRTAAPLVVFGLAASALLYGLQERVLAPARREADRLERVIRKWPALSSPLDRRWAVGADGSMYHYDFFDSSGNRFSRLHVYRLDPRSWTLRGMTFSRDAAPFRALDPADGGLIRWTGRQGWERSFGGAARARDHTAVQYTAFAEKEFWLEPPTYFRSEIPDADMMTYGQLRDFIGRLQGSGSDAARYVVALQRKVAFPLTTIILTLLAVPFAATTGRRGALYGIGAALAIAITYRIAESVFGAFGAGGLLPPVLAAWAPNLLFGAAAGYMILTVRT